MEDFTPSNACAATAEDIAYIDTPSRKPAATAEPEIPDYLIKLTTQAYTCTNQTSSLSIYEKQTPNNNNNEV